MLYYLVVMVLMPKNFLFPGELWLAVAVSVVAWGGSLWLVQRAWWLVAGGPAVRFNVALQYSWGALLQQPPPDPSLNMSGRVHVAFNSILEKTDFLLLLSPSSPFDIYICKCLSLSRPLELRTLMQLSCHSSFVPMFLPKVVPDTEEQMAL